MSFRTNTPVVAAAVLVVEVPHHLDSQSIDRQLAHPPP
jgi:hypothetical protein